MKNWTSNQWPKNRIGGYVAIPIIIAAAAAAVQVTAANKQAAVATSVANYNAKLDIKNAQQLALNAQANVAKQRTENEAYRSKIRVAYAASGILSGSGTPMSVLATTAGRQEQDIQNYWSSVNQKSDQYYAKAAEGIAEGDAMADVYHLQAASAAIKGIGSMASAFGTGGAGMSSADVDASKSAMSNAANGGLGGYQ